MRPLRLRARPWQGLLLLFVLLAALEPLGRFGFVDTRLFPLPSQVLAKLAELLATESFLQHLRASLARLLPAMGIATSAALGLVILSALSRKLHVFSEALAGMIYPLPKSAIFPFFLLVFGTDGKGHVALIALGCLSTMLATLLQGLHRLETQGLFSLARQLQLTRRTLVARVLLPGLVPELIQALKLSLSYALVLVVVVEMILTDQGIGVHLWLSWDAFRILDLYAGLALICLWGLVVFALSDWLAARLSFFQGTLK